MCIRDSDLADGVAHQQHRGASAHQLAHALLAFFLKHEVTHGCLLYTSPNSSYRPVKHKFADKQFPLIPHEILSGTFRKIGRRVHVIQNAPPLRHTVCERAVHLKEELFRLALGKSMCFGDTDTTDQAIHVLFHLPLQFRHRGRTSLQRCVCRRRHPRKICSQTILRTQKPERAPNFCEIRKVQCNSRHTVRAGDNTAVQALSLIHISRYPIWRQPVTRNPFSSKYRWNPFTSYQPVTARPSAPR